VRSMGIDDAELHLITPEEAPLALFGSAASAAVADLLKQAGITFTGSTAARPGPDGRLVLTPGEAVLGAERIVALPTLEGPQIQGVPGDALGFIPTDEHGRVPGLPDVYAAGDGSSFPVKQGGLACQQADAIAELLSAAAGADVEPQPFRPVLRGRLLVGRGAQYLEQELHGGEEGAVQAASELVLWSVPRKVEGRYLSPWLEELEGGAATPEPEAAVAEEEHIDIEVALPNDYEIRRSAMSLDPYSPMSGR
jgi:sulfide:quinone oxidoreductase